MSSLSRIRSSGNPTPTCASSLQSSPGVQSAVSRFTDNSEEFATLGAGGVTILELAGAEIALVVEIDRFKRCLSIFDDEVK